MMILDMLSTALRSCNWCDVHLSPLTGVWYTGSALAADAVRVAELADAAESVKAKLPELPNPFFGRSKDENKGPQVSGLFSPEVFRL